MINPHEAIRTYLKLLINNFLKIRSIEKQLKIINDWNKPPYNKTIQLSFNFFDLVVISFHQTVLLDLNKLLSDNEEKSITDWLKKARMHSQVIEPRYYDHQKGERVSLNSDEYQKIIDLHLKKIIDNDCIIKKIKKWRDKFLAHSDTTYFNNPNKLYIDFPIVSSEIQLIEDIIADILRYHHIHLLDGDVTLQVFSIGEVSTILSYAQAFKKTLDDQELRRLGFVPAKYLK